MRAVLLSILLSISSSALAQNKGPDLPAACGPDKVTFSAQESASVVSAPAPAQGRAVVYFIQDRGEAAENQHFTVKIGVDGAWVGAYKNNSVFAISVDPGEHHLCANVQSKFAAGLNIALAHFTAQPGQVYYFRTRFLGQFPGRLDLDQPDSDQAQYLIATYPASLFKAKQ
jgi:hypothetical protein